MVPKFLTPETRAIFRKGSLATERHIVKGTPRTLLEAAAMARPIITTDAVGCREVVDDGVNGYLCQVRDAADLAEKMSQMLLLSSAQREAMGLRGRAKMEAEFDEQIVIDRYLAAIDASHSEAQYRAVKRSVK